MTPKNTSIEVETDANERTFDMVSNDQRHDVVITGCPAGSRDAYVAKFGKGGKRRPLQGKVHLTIVGRLATSTDQLSIYDGRGLLLLQARSIGDEIVIEDFRDDSSFVVRQMARKENGEGRRVVLVFRPINEDCNTETAVLKMRASRLSSTVAVKDLWFGMTLASFRKGISSPRGGKPASKLRVFPGGDIALLVLLKFCFDAISIEF